MPATRVINGFQGEYRFLSNFYPSPILYRSEWWPTVEHAYQASKCIDKTEYLACLEFRSQSPGAAKRRGRTVKLRKDWDYAKVLIMTDLIRIKFLSFELARSLLATGTAYLEEMNTWGDEFWGVCNGRGSNMLGIILMGVRASLEDMRKLSLAKSLLIEAEGLLCDPRRGEAANDMAGWIRLYLDRLQRGSGV